MVKAGKWRNLQKSAMDRRHWWRQYPLRWKAKGKQSMWSGVMFEIKHSGRSECLSSNFQSNLNLRCQTFNPEWMNEWMNDVEYSAPLLPRREGGCVCVCVVVVVGGWWQYPISVCDDNIICAEVWILYEQSDRSECSTSNSAWKECSTSNILSGLNVLSRFRLTECSIKKNKTGLNVRHRTFSLGWMFDQTFSPDWILNIKHSVRAQCSPSIVQALMRPCAH